MGTGSVCVGSGLFHTLVVGGRVKMGWGACMPHKDTDGLKIDWPSGLLSWARGGRGVGSSPAVTDGLGEEA